MDEEKNTNVLGNEEQNQEENLNNENTPRENEEENQDSSLREELEKAKAEAAKYKRLFNKTNKKAENKEQKTNEDFSFGYAEKAYLNTLGYKEPEIQEIIVEEAKATGKSLEEVTQFKYLQEMIQEKRVSIENAKANVRSDERGGNTSVDSVEYWIAKGELPPADQVELRRKVVNAKIARAKNKTKFGTGEVDIR